MDVPDFLVKLFHWLQNITTKMLRGTTTMKHLR